MAAAFRAATTFKFVAAGTTRPLPTHAAGDMLLILVLGKPYNAEVSVPTSGWTFLDSGASGTTGAGVDVGSEGIWVWYKEATSSSETTPDVDEGSNSWNNVAIWAVSFSKDASETWETPVVAFGGDEDLDADPNITLTSDPGVTAGDVLAVGLVSCSDASGPFTSEAITQTGVTFGTLNVDADDESTGGGDAAVWAGHVAASSGTSSAAPVITSTATADPGSPRFEACVVRLRVSAGSTSLVIQDATHAHAADNLALTQHNVLAIQDATHGHTADNVALGVDLVIQEATHGHTADNLGLTQHHVLAIQDATHGHTAENQALTQHNVLAIQDATHAHAADNLALTQHNVLAVADALHAHAADNLTLTAHEPGAGSLEIQDAAHAHAADSLVLGVGLVIADATHGHAADNLSLTQHNILAIADALHAHTADNLGLSLPGEEPETQNVVRLRRRKAPIGTG